MYNKKYINSSKDIELKLALTTVHSLRNQNDELVKKTIQLENQIAMLNQQIKDEKMAKRILQWNNYQLKNGIEILQNKIINKTD